MIFGKRSLGLAVASALITILVLFMVTSTVMASEQVSALSMENEEIVQFSELLTMNYLTFLGYRVTDTVQSEANSAFSYVHVEATYEAISDGTFITIKVESMLQVFQDHATKGYNYKAEITTSSLEKYTVTTSFSILDRGHKITTISDEQITGSMNYHFSAIDNKKILGDYMNRWINVYLQFSNASGSYYLNVESFAIWSSDESTIFEGNGTIDQNLFEPVGHFVFSMVPSTDGNGVKVTVTLPDGSIIDPGIYQFVDSWHGSYHLVGWKLWWETWVGITIDLIMWVISGVLILATSLATLGVGLWVISGVLILSDMFITTSGYIYMYFEVILIEWWIFSLPIFAEIGYWSNQVIGTYLGRYFYLPIYNTNQAFFGAPYGPPRTSPWPPGY